jgi:hypothetical protein
LAQEVRAEKEKEREAETTHDGEAQNHAARIRETKDDESASAQEQRGIDSPQKDQGAGPQGVKDVFKFGKKVHCRACKFDGWQIRGEAKT